MGTLRVLMMAVPPAGAPPLPAWGVMCVYVCIGMRSCTCMLVRARARTGGWYVGMHGPTWVRAQQCVARHARECPPPTHNSRRAIQRSRPAGSVATHNASAALASHPPQPKPRPAPPAPPPRNTVTHMHLEVPPPSTHTTTTRTHTNAPLGGTWPCRTRTQCASSPQCPPPSADARVRTAAHGSTR